MIIEFDGTLNYENDGDMDGVFREWVTIADENGASLDYILEERGLQLQGTKVS